MGRLFWFFKRRVTGSCGAFFIFRVTWKYVLFQLFFTIIADDNTNALMLIGEKHI